MEIIIYPIQDSDDASKKGQVRRMLASSLVKHPRLFTLVRETLQAIEREPSLDFLTRSGKEERLTGCSEPIHVLKIPPKKCREGVVRLYFAFDADDPSRIWILAGEHKHGRIKDDRELIHTAIRHYRTICKP
jgi:hypothetical protein